MLVITRRPGQSFSIGDDIQVHVVEIKGCQARIAIKAPRDVLIMRDEIKGTPKRTTAREEV